MSVHQDVIFALMLVLVGASCTTQSKMVAPDIPDAFVEPLDANIAVYYAEELKNHELVVSQADTSLSNTHIIPLGQVSIGMFGQAIRESFANVVTLDSMEDAHSLDVDIIGILVPRIDEANSTLWVPPPILIPGWAINLDVCLTVDLIQADGSPTISWTHEFSKHQEKKLGAFPDQVETLLSELLRDAASAFIVDFTRTHALAGSQESESDVRESRHP